MTQRPPADDSQEVVADSAEESQQVPLSEITQVISVALDHKIHEYRAQFVTDPFPATAKIERLNEMYPGSTKIIVDAFEAQGKHRRAIESYSIRAGTQRSFAGLICGFLIALAFLLAAFLLVMNGHDAAGVILGTVDLERPAIGNG